MYKIVIEKKAEKSLHALDQSVRMRVAEDVYSLGTRFMDGKRLSGELRNARSFRSGEYRIVYSVDFEKELVKIHRIGDRKDVYRR